MLPSILLLLGLFAPNLALYLCGQGQEEEWYSGFCTTKNMACLVDNSTDNLIYEFDNTNMLGCSERCSLATDCTTWTWWGNTNVCQLFSSCTKDRSDCCDCQTGPRSCGIWEDHVSAVSGGEGGHDKVFMVGQDGLCQGNSSLQMPSPRWGHTSAFIKSRLILCGGSLNETTSVTPDASCDIYCLEGRSWSQGAAMATPRHNAAGVALLGKMYLVGGNTGEATYTPTMEVYDPTKDTWSQGPDMPIAVTAACAVTHRDAIIVTGGLNATGETHDVHMFNVTTNQWYKMAPMQQARARHGCSLNQRPAVHMAPVADVIVTGGQFKGTPLSSSEVFNVDTFKWSPFPRLTVPLESHVQADLGRPVVLGGLQTGEASHEVLQYRNKEWEQADYTLPANLTGHSATNYPRDLVKC